MSTNLVEEIKAVAATLPLEKQREALALMEKLAAQDNQSEPDNSTPARRLLKGDLAHLGSSITSEDIDEARREMWSGYMEGDE